MNRSRALAERSPDLTQRLPLFPSLPEVSFLGHRQARTSHLSHHNHPPTPLYPRGCCIDRLNSPYLSLLCQNGGRVEVLLCIITAFMMHNKSQGQEGT